MQLFEIKCNYMQFRAEHSEICKKFVYEKCAYFAWRKYVENMSEPRLQQIKSRGAFNTFLVFWGSICHRQEFQIAHGTSRPYASTQSNSQFKLVAATLSFRSSSLYTPTWLGCGQLPT